MTPSAGAGEGGSVLVVEDDEALRQIIGKDLGECGYQVTQACDGGEAIDRVEAGRYDLVVLDLGLPVVGGVDVLRHLRKRYSAADLPVIVATARNKSDDVVAALDLGANDYVVKPFDRHVLLARVHAQLEVRKATRLKDDLLAMASHDLKGPLTVIRGVASFLNELPLGELPPEQVHDLLASVHENARHMQRLVEDLLDLQAVEAGHVRLSTQSVQLNDLLRKVAEKYRAYADSKQVQIDEDLEADLPPAQADPDRIGQVLENLVDNAIKFAPPGGVAIVRTRCREGEVTVEVCDSGPGFLPSELGRVFERHAVLRNLPTGKEKSTGLGLAICKQLLELHHRDIYVRNNAEQGATFWFTLPASQPLPAVAGHLDGPARLTSRGPHEPPRVGSGEAPRDPRRAAPPALPDPAPSPLQETILVVDDDKISRDMLSHCLQDNGFRVLTAADGREGLSLLQREAVDLVLLDVLMPDVGGLEVLRVVRQEHPVSDLPIIMATALDDSEDTVLALRAGANDYVTKPLDLAVVLARTETQLSLNRAMRKIQELDRQKNQLLGMAAHDLRNPLTIVKACADFLDHSLAGRLDARQAEWLNLLRESTVFMIDLISELLSVSQIEAGELRLDLHPVSVVDLVEQNIRINLPLAEQKGIQILLEHPEDLPLVEVDGPKIEQVLNNLISNAVKFSNPGTTVHVSVSKKKASLEISVQDQGQGIPGKEMDGLFRPFARTSVRATAGERSTGLGLAISKRIVEGHQGEIRAESEVGVGSVFTFSLPLEPSVPQAASDLASHNL